MTSASATFTPYDNTHERQFRVLPSSHPEEFAAWFDSGQASQGTDDKP